MKAKTQSPYYRKKMCDLPLGYWQKYLAHLQSLVRHELEQKGLAFDFSLYVSEEWFCPDGRVSIAVPFYIFNPDLMAIEKREMGEVEGFSTKDQLRFLRHELGHCIDNAFRLRKCKERQMVFGSSKVPYPDSYQPKKYSRAFVDYLGDNYGQSHPDEDFAETFAAWLDPSFDNRGLGTVAGKKYFFMEELMTSLIHRKQQVRCQWPMDPIEKNTMTLRRHYQKRRAAKGFGSQRFIRHQIERDFRSQPRSKDCIALTQYLRRERKNLSRKVAEKTGTYSYRVDLAIERTLRQAENLKAFGTKAQLRQKAPILIEGNYRYLIERNQLKYFL